MVSAQNYCVGVFLVHPMRLDPLMRSTALVFHYGIANMLSPGRRKFNTTGVVEETLHTIQYPRNS